VPAAAPAAPPKTSGMAVASLVLGICGLLSCGITSLVGLILGIVALVRINKSRGQQSGQGLAIAGIVVSGVFLLMIPIWAGMLLPALAKAKMKAQSINCVNNAKQLALGIVMYSADNNDQFPAAATWCDAIQQYLGPGKAFQCVSGDASKRCHYAFNAKLDGLEAKKVTDPAHTVLVFETEGGWNINGGPELLPAKPRHGPMVVLGFADGHVEQVTKTRLKDQRWDP
jgi:prepilin-type processing-associated H-X9-DG protein